MCVVVLCDVFFFFSSRRRHTRCALVTGVQTCALPIYGGATDRIALAVPVTASISGRCGFSTPPDTNVELGNLEAGFSRDIPFVLQCNTPMSLAMVSQNGGLKVASAPPEGFTNLLEIGRAHV